MKKLFTSLKFLLVAVCLLGGGNSAWADEVFGLTSDGYLGAHSTPITMYDGGTLHYVFSQVTAATANAQGFVLVADDRAGNKLVALRGDNWENVAWSNEGITNNYNWTNFPALMNGASIDMTVTYVNGTFTMTSAITGSDSNNYTYTYTKTIAGSPVAIVVYLSEEAAQITISETTYTNSKVVATLEHTAGAQWGSNTGASTVDAEKEHYNNDASSAWAGCAYAKFSFTIPAGHTVTSAKLTYSVNQGGSSGRNDIIYYMKKDFDLNWATFAGQTGTDLRNTGSRADKAVAAAPTGGTGDRLNLVQDITAAVSAILAEGQDYIVLQWTGNAGGADLYGKGSTANSPILLIETSAETLYTATFTEGNSLAPTVTIYSNSERTAEVTNGTLRNGITYYYTATLTGYRDYLGSFTVASADPAVNFTMEAKAMYGYTVNAVDASSNVLYKVAEGSVYENENVTVPYNAFYLKSDGNLLQANRLSADSKQYQYTFNVDVDDKVVTITYNSTSYSNVVFYQEAEDVATLTEATGGNVPVRCSGGKGAYAASDAVITTLGPGKYKLSSFAYGNGGTELSVYAGDNLVKTFTTAASTLGVTTSDEFTLNATTDITFKAGGNGGSSPKVLDFFFIQKTAEVVTIPASGYASLASAHALDFANATGLTAAYVVSATAKDHVSLTAVTEMPANSGVILEGTGGETYAIPTLASASFDGVNKLKAAVTATPVAANEAYILQNGEFHLVTGASEVPAGKAYLLATDVPASVRALDMVVDGDADGITAIDNAQSAGNAMFDLSGRRVAKAQKGIYIVNGKKVVK